MTELEYAKIDCGVVVIGRNEGERLRRCIESVVKSANAVVYVDSGSTDDSVEMVLGMGVEVVELDLAIPFTAARARNAGFWRLRQIAPGLSVVQFVDGDCEVVAGWLRKAYGFLDKHCEVVAVCGRRRERYPEKTIYNMLCDIEWDTPVGETRSCGGDVMMRTEALEKVNGYRPDLIAGEEPELCVRLRGAGGKIWRLDAEMTLHDAAISRFGQWWTRTLRSGHAFAQGAHLHGNLPEHHGVRESRRAWVWGLAIPVVVLLLCFWLGFQALFLLLIYPLQIVRLALRGKRPPRENWWRAVYLVLGKFPEMLGQLKFHTNRWCGSQSRLIEYK